MGAVINNSRTAENGPRTPNSAARGTSITSNAGSSTKWARDLGKTAEDEFGDWPLSPEDEKAIVEQAKATFNYNRDTPRKAIKTDRLMTPGTKRKWEEDTLPTPATRPTSYIKLEERTEKEQLSLHSPYNTPTPSRYHDALRAGEAEEEITPRGYDISEEVMELLEDEDVGEKKISQLRDLLNKHALKISGIAKGRDITRVALKAKDAKIAELQQKITALETEREMDKTIIQHFKSDMAHSISSRRGKGRRRGRS